LSSTMPIDPANEAKVSGAVRAPISSATDLEALLRVPHVAFQGRNFVSPAGNTDGEQELTPPIWQRFRQASPRYIATLAQPSCHHLGVSRLAQRDDFEGCDSRAVQRVRSL